MLLWDSYSLEPEVVRYLQTFPNHNGSILDKDAKYIILLVLGECIVGPVTGSILERSRRDYNDPVEEVWYIKVI